MTHRSSWRGEIEVVYSPADISFFWFDDAQIRQSLSCIAALVRALEGLLDRQPVGVREQRIGSGRGAVINDIAIPSGEDVAAVRQRWIQDAEVVTGDAASGYRLETDGVQHGMLLLTIPNDRREQFASSIEDFLERYAKSSGVPFRFPWKRK